jgi:rhamnosyltransferase
MISVVIRNKNEAYYLERTLKILTQFYADYIDEIILVDNQSTDTSLLVGAKYNCKIVTSSQFTYGSAINLGIKNTKNEIILLLSSHAVPIGNSFFKNSIRFISDKKDWAGVRFINSVQNFERALVNDFKVKQPLDFGLMAACCLVSKSVWKQFKFDEFLPFSEDKEWSQKVMKNGYTIYDFNETFFYDINRSEVSQLHRFKNETLATYTLQQEMRFPTDLKIVLSFFKKVFVTNVLQFFKSFSRDFKRFKVKLWISHQLKKVR